MTRLWFWMAPSLPFWGLCTYLMLFLPYRVWRSTMKKLKPSGLAPLKVLILLFLQVNQQLGQTRGSSHWECGFRLFEDKATLNSNFIEKIEKIRSILDNWLARRLTPLGKITIIKTLAVSQIVCILSSLPTPFIYLYTIIHKGFPSLWMCMWKIKNKRTRKRPCYQMRQKLNI